MTAIVFHQGKLYGDRRNLQVTNPVTFIDRQKIHKSKDGQFAYGVSGKTVDEDSRMNYELVIRKVIEKMIVTGADRLPLSDVIGEDAVKKGLDFTHAVFATNNQQYLLQDLGVVYVRRLDGSTHGVGTGGTFLSSMLRCGLSIKEAAKRIRRLDHLSGDVFNSIDTTRLRQFIIKGV